MATTLSQNCASAKSLVHEVRLAEKNRNTNYPYTIAFSNWLNGFEEYKITTYESKGRGGKLYQCGRALELSIPAKNGQPILEKKKFYGSGDTKKDAYEFIFREAISYFFGVFGIEQVQMDDLTSNGLIDPNVVVDRESNVILELESQAQEVKVLEISSSEINKKLASSESPYDMIGTGYSLMNRWYPLQMVKIEANSKLLFSLNIPSALYVDKTSVNLLPLRAFIYGDLDIEFKLVLNSAPFHAGRILMGAFYCPQGMNASYSHIKYMALNPTDGACDFREISIETEISTVEGMVQRPHVMLDLSQSTSASLLLKYNYNKPFVRLLDYQHNKAVNPGVQGGYFANLSALMVSPLRTGSDNPQYVNCSLFYRFVKADLTGMTRQHDLTQMDSITEAVGLLDVVVPGIGAGVKVMKGIESQLRARGKKSSNRDKPSVQFNNSIVLPRPRLHFPNGVGLSDATILGMDVMSQTTHYESPGLGPTSYIEYAKMPGILKVIQWSLSDEVKKTIFTETVLPYLEYRDPIHDPKTGGFLYSSDFDKVPLHIATNGFMYWGGTIVYEFDIVKTAYHKGSIMISISYGKETSADMGSNYEKIVDVQDTSKIKITVPYIYDTVARRTNVSPYFSTWGQIGNWSQDNLPTYSRTKITVKVINPLVDIGSVSSVVDVIVWKYAGEDFFLSGPCQVNNILSLPADDNGSDSLVNFPTWQDMSSDPIFSYPYNYVMPPYSFKQTTYRSPIPVGISEYDYYENLRKEEIARNPPADITTHAANAQTQDTTQMDVEDFNVGKPDPERMRTGDDTNFKNLLRMPLRVVYGFEVGPTQTFNWPVMPLASELLRNYGMNARRLFMTHQSQITRMHRMWRGTMRYTIVIHYSAGPVFISYTPPDGSFKKRIRHKNWNERTYRGYRSYKNFTPFFAPVDPNKVSFPDLSGSGNYTTMILAAVNPSETVEIPWNLPVNWALINQGNRYSQRTSRDIGQNNNGHLCIYSDESFKMSMFMSVGDDFELAAFCGMTDYLPSFVPSAKMDDYRGNRTQMGFPECGLLSDDETKYYSANDQMEEDRIGLRAKCLSAISKYGYLVKPAAMMVSAIVPAPMGDVIRQTVIAHTVYSITNNVMQVGEGINRLTTLENAEKLNSVLNDGVRVMHGAGQMVDIMVEGEVASNIVDLTSKIALGTDMILPSITNSIMGVEKAVGAVSSFTDYVQGPNDETGILAWIGEMIGVNSEIGWVGNIKGLFEKLYDSIVNLDASSFSSALLDAMTTLGFVSWDFLRRKMGLFTTYITNIVKSIFCGDRTQMESDTQQVLRSVYFEQSDIQSLLGLMFGGMLSIYGANKSASWLPGHKQEMSSWSQSFFSGRSLSTINSAFVFVRNIYGVANKMIVSILGRSDPELMVRKMLIENPSVISDFVKNATFFLNNYNDILYSDPGYKSRFWVTVCNAFQLNAHFARIKGDSSLNSLKLLCRDVIKKANENVSLFQSTAVRYEPFVACIEGLPGIGKSFLTAELSTMIMENLDIKANSLDFRYNVTPGVDYWNLYNGQPIIIYDDWCNLTDSQSVRREISELYQLKTSNVMNAPKAELSEKKMVVNPFAVLLATNNPFPTPNGVNSHLPVYRRRDILVKARLRPDLQGKNLTSENYENYSHLEFGIYDGVLRSQDHFQWLKWPQFRDVFNRVHKQYHAKESANVKSRIRILSKSLSEQALIHSNISDPFTLQAQSLYRMEQLSSDAGVVHSLPSEMLEAQVRDLIQLIHEDYKIVKTTQGNFYVQGQGKAIHAVQPDNTEMEGIMGDYFITPIVNSYQALKGFVSQILYKGLNCQYCGRNCLNGLSTLKCQTCNIIVCGMCVGRGEEHSICREGHRVEIYIPPFVDIFISFICSALLRAVAPMNISDQLLMYVCNYFSNWEAHTPFLIIAFIKKMILLSKEAKLSVLGGKIPVSMLDKTQIDEVPIVTYTKAPNLRPGSKDIPSKKGSLTDLDKVRISDGSSDEDEPVIGWSQLVNKQEQESEIEVAVDIGEEGRLSKEKKKLPADDPVVKVLAAKDLSQIPSRGVLEEFYAKVHHQVDQCLHDRLDKGKAVIDLRDNEWCIIDANHKALPLGKCGITCTWSIADLEAMVKECWETNYLAYNQTIQAVFNGSMAKDGLESIPPFFLPTYVKNKIMEQVNKHTEEFSWWSYLLVKISQFSIGAAMTYGLVHFGGKLVAWIHRLFFGHTQQSNSDYHNKVYVEKIRARGKKIGKTQAAGVETSADEVCQAEESEMFQNIKKKIINNYVIFRTSSKQRLVGLGIFGSTVIIPKHYIPVLQQSEELWVSFVGVRYEDMKLNPKNMKVRCFTNKDCALLTLGKALYFADIRKFFKTEEEMRSFDAVNGQVVLPTDDDVLDYPIKFISMPVSPYTALDDQTGYLYTSQGVIDYTFQRKGACGSVILACGSTHPILGFHVAGNDTTGKGTGVLLHRCDLTDDFAMDMAPVPFELKELEVNFGEDVNVEYLGCLDKSLIPFMPTKTSLSPSLISDCFKEPTLTQPAILSCRDTRYKHGATPLIDGVKKHGKPTLDFDRDMVDRASQFWKCILLQKPWQFEHKVQIYNLKQAAVGRLDTPNYYEWLPDNTSAGWPYNTIRKNVNGMTILASKKKHWVKYIRDPVSDRPVDVEFDELILEHIERDMKFRRKGLLAPTVFQDILKDEKRPIEKLMKMGGTRVISMSPVTASLVMRQYSLDFTSYLRKQRISNWMAIGINPDGPEWGHVARRLGNVGNNLFSIDFSNFGPGLNLDVACEFLAVMKQFYMDNMEGGLPQEEAVVMDTLIHELLTSIHLAGSTLYRTKSGSPSGAAITVEMNSFVHLMYIAIAWQIIAKVVRYMHQGYKGHTVYKGLIDHFERCDLDTNSYLKMDETMDNMLDNLTGVVYGDDGVFSVSDKYKKVFNAKTLRLVFLAHNICATDASKSEVCMETCGIEDVTFLKRRFVPHPRHAMQWAGPMDEISIKECARWIHRSANEENDTIINVHASLLLAYGHGPDWYRRWKEELDKHLRGKDLPCVHISWEEIDRLFYPDYYIGEFDDSKFLNFNFNILGIDKEE